MPCATCGDTGVIALNWSDAEWEYALCLGWPQSTEFY